MSDAGSEPISSDPPSLSRPVMMHQHWRDVSFLHWAVEPSRVANRMPPGVRPDTLDGLTYVGLIPFRMVDAGIARGPAVPWAGSFLETNVRLYSVDGTGRRGIVFLSLDTDRAVIVAGARAGLGLPYRWARMRYCEDAGIRAYDARLRRLGSRPRSHISVRVGAPRDRTLVDDFLTARWGLHVRWWGRTLYVPNRHEAWAVREAELVALDDELLASVGLGELAARRPDHVAFSHGVYTEFGLPGDATSPRR